MRPGLVGDLIFLVVLCADIGAFVLVGLTLLLHPAPVARRIALRAMARDVILADQARPRRARIARELAERHRLLIGVAPFLLVGAILYLPIPSGPLPALFGSRESSEDFVGTMWQVVAGALGLSVAMIAFAFEAFFSSSQRQVGGSLREFAGETHLLTVVRLGVAALLIDGLVLLGVGHDAPAGWAATWATIVSATTLLGVPYVLSKVVRALEVEELLRMRRSRLRVTVGEALWQQLLGQAADAILLQTPHLGVRRELLKRPGEVAIGPRGEGIVGDVHLGSLARLVAFRAAPGKDVSVSLLVGLGSRVDDQSDVISLDADSGKRARWLASRAIKIKSTDSAERSLVDQLGRIHGEATVTLREGRVEDWRPLGGLYRLVLLELVRAARRHGIPFEGSVAAPGLFGFGPAQRISSYLRDELAEAVRTESADGADAVAYLPGMISREAMREGALAVVKEMLRLYPGMYVIGRAHGLGQNRAAGLVLDRASSYLLEYDALVEGPFREAGSSAAERAQAMELGEALYLQIAAILKLALEDGDTETFGNLESRWAELFEDEIGYLHDLGAGTAKEPTPPSLDSYRLVLVLGLAMWSAHLYGKSDPPAPPEDQRSLCLRILAGRFVDPQSLLEAHEEAMQREQSNERGLPFTSWFLDEFGEGWHGIPSEAELLFTTLLILVGRADFDLTDLELRPSTWQRHSVQDTETALKRLREEAGRWSPVFDVGAGMGTEVPEGGEWTARVDRVEELLQEAAAAAEEERRAEIRAAPLDPARVEKFRDTVLREAAEGRVLRDLFATQGALMAHEGQPEGERTIFPLLLSKGLFTSRPHVHGLTHTAKAFGRRARGSGSEALAAALAQIEPAPFEGDIASRLREAIAEMGEAGHPASLLLIPISWRLREALGLAPWGGPGATGSELVPLAHAMAFAGIFEEVPVLELTGPEDDRLWLVDLAAVARFEEWPSERDSGFLLELRDFDAEGAAAMLAEHPELRGEGEGPEQALKTLQEKVFAKLVFCWRIEAGSTKGGICLLVTEELRR